MQAVPIARHHADQQRPGLYILASLMMKLARIKPFEN